MGKLGTGEEDFEITEQETHSPNDK